MKKISVYNIALIAAFVALISVCAWITLPFPVPFTMQLFAIFIAVGVLGTCKGFVCVLIYLVIGFCGAPIFSGFSGGISRLFTVSGGFLIGFLALSLVTGFLSKKLMPSFKNLFIADILGNIAVYVCAVLWSAVLFPENIKSAAVMVYMSGVLPFIVPDIIKAAISAIIVVRLKKVFIKSFNMPTEKRKSESLDSIFSEKIKENLTIPVSEVMSFRIIDSTNTFLDVAAKNGAADRTVVVSLSQTAGRGRHGKSFYSPSGSGLYLSILLRPNIDFKKTINITTCTAVAVCKALENMFSVNPEIKWVNDIFLNGKKICGILTEEPFNYEKKPEYVIIGIGINLKCPEGGFPVEIKETAGAVLPAEKKITDIREKAAAEIINKFFECYELLGSDEIFEMYKERMFLMGRKITVMGEENRKAVVTGLEKDYSLTVRFEDGSIKKLDSGEISVRAD